MKKKEKCQLDCGRLGKVGGQAVLEGVMMKAGSRTVTTCRKEDGSLVVTDDSFVSVRKKHKILNLPILRGIINFVEMMILSVKTLGASADALGLDDAEEESRFEKWLKEKCGVKITAVVMGIATVLGLALSVLLFVLLPGWISYGLNLIVGVAFGADLGVFTAVVEGVVKVGIFLAYLSLVSLMPDIKRTFMYHGAEHKSIACFEAGEELTPENAMKHLRFHPRCGTSFMFFMILLGIIAGLFIKFWIPGLDMWAYSLIRIAILPLLVGVGFEVIMLAGKHVNPVTKFISAPGLWVQRITTKEPTLDMLEVAIVSIKCALRDDFPEFGEFFAARGWEKNSDAVADTETEEACKKQERVLTETEENNPFWRAIKQESFDDSDGFTVEFGDKEEPTAPLAPHTVKEPAVEQSQEISEPIVGFVVKIENEEVEVGGNDA